MLIIYTQKYMNIMKLNLRNASIISTQSLLKTDYIKNEYKISLPNNEKTHELLSKIICDCLIKDNEIISVSPSLREIFAKVANDNFYEEIKFELRKYFINNKKINLDGFVKFRMQEYSWALDKALYGLIKSIIMKP